MKKKYSLILSDDFVEYCKINDIFDVEKYAEKVFNDAYLLIKYNAFINNKIIKKEIKNEEKTDNKSVLYDE